MFQHCIDHSIYIIIFVAALMSFLHCACEVDVLILRIPWYLSLPEDDNLTMKHAGGLMFMDNF
jgi:hypothetical protein